MQHTPLPSGGPLADLLQGLIQQPQIGFVSQVDSPVAASEAQSAVITDAVAFGSVIIGVPISAGQGLWGELPQVAQEQNMSLQGIRLTDPWRAP